MTSSSFGTPHTHGQPPPQQQHQQQQPQRFSHEFHPHSSSSSSHSVQSGLQAAPSPSPSPSKSSCKEPLFDAESMQQQMQLFVMEELYDSAQLLGEFLVSIALSTSAISNSTSMHNSSFSSLTMTTSTGASPGVPVASSIGGGSMSNLSREFHAKTFCLFADVLMGKHEYKRAIQFYKRYWKMRSLSNANSNSVTPEVVSIKVKIAKCWMALNNSYQALEVLNSIPQQFRSLNVNLLLGKLYILEGLKSKAEESYTLALRQNPYALEATLALAELAGDKELLGTNDLPISSSSNRSSTREIERFYTKLSNLRSSNRYIARADAKWMQLFVNAHLFAKQFRYRNAVESVEFLDELFPNNLHCWLLRATIEMDQGMHLQAQASFVKARQVDELNLDRMDMFANCLRKNGAQSALSGLVYDLFDVHESGSGCNALVSSTSGSNQISSPSNASGYGYGQPAESWLAAAYLSALKKDKDMAMQFCERSLLVNRRFANAHLFRGKLLLEGNRPEHALISFTTCCKLQKSFAAYAGMIKSYCALFRKGINRHKEALSTAKTLLKVFPQQAKSFVLLGNVFCLRPEGKDQARKAYQKALGLDPRCLKAIFGLVSILVSEGNLSSAIDKLSRLAEQTACERVYTKLADVHTLNKQFSEAMTNYHRALSLNGSYGEALNGLERLEKLMRGEDPDASSLNNSTMDPMDADEAEESMEVGEYIAS